MAADLRIVSSCCPAGCGDDVVLLVARRIDVVFAYCHLCGCTWAHPMAARFERGLQEVTPLWVRAPYGVEWPEAAAIAAAGLDHAVLRTVSASDWSTTLDELNAEIAREIATNRPLERPGTSAPRPSECVCAGRSTASR